MVNVITLDKLSGPMCYNLQCVQNQALSFLISCRIPVYFRLSKQMTLHTLYVFFSFLGRKLQNTLTIVTTEIE